MKIPFLSSRREGVSIPISLKNDSKSLSVSKRKIKILQIGLLTSLLLQACSKETSVNGDIGPCIGILVFGAIAALMLGWTDTS